METSSSRAPRPDSLITTSNGSGYRGDISDKGQGIMNVDGKDTPSSASSSQRPVRYKEKFQALREKYEQVMGTHTQYEKELALANKKIQELQNECNLLLDAVDIAVPGQPTLQHYLNYDPVPPYMTSAPSSYMTQTSAPGTGGPNPPPLPADESAVKSASTPRPSSQHTNGVNGH